MRLRDTPAGIDADAALAPDVRAVELLDRRLSRLIIAALLQPLPDPIERVLLCPERPAIVGTAIRYFDRITLLA